MKIAYIISDINKAVFFENTALSLRQEGFDACYIVINYENGALVEFLKANGFNYYTLKSAKISRSLPQILKVRKILKKENIELVHCHLAQANWIGLWAAYLCRIPNRIYTRHSGEPLKVIWKERVIDYIQNRIATRIVSISKVIDALLEKQKVPPFKRQILHHGFELTRFSANDETEITRIKNSYNPENNSPVIGVIARWMEWKGIQHVVEAFVLLLEKEPNALLCLFGAQGQGDYHEQLSNLLHKIPEKNLCIVPFENNVFDLYQLFDVYVHVPVNPSCEAFGQTYVEALAAEVPSVFTPSGIAQEFIVDREHALVVPFGDPAAIFNAITELLRNKQLVRQITTQGKQIVYELFDFSVYRKNLVSFYEGLQSQGKKKIMYVVSDVGRAVYFEETAIALRDLNYEVEFVLISCKNSALDTFLKKNHFKRYYLEVDKLMNSARSIWRLRKIFKYEKPDLIHCHLSKANWVGLNAGWLAGVKNRIYTRHSGKPLQQSRKELLIDKVQNRIATHIVAISENISRLLQEQGIKPEKRTLIYHGFDLERFQHNDAGEIERIIKQYNPERRRPVIGVISRWMELKGIEYIVEAFSEILPDHPDALLCLFGASTEGEYPDQIHHTLRLLPGKNVRLVPFENNCFDLYRLFDIYVHVPVNETCEAFGQTYVEALASGTPSVFTLSGIAPEFIRHSENALVVPFKDAKAIELSIRELLSNEALRNALAENGRHHLEDKFGLQLYIDNLSALYSSKIGKSTS